MDDQSLVLLRRCSKRKQHKSRDQFGRAYGRHRGPDALRGWCKTCFSAYQRGIYQQNKDDRAAAYQANIIELRMQAWARLLKRKYQMTPEQYDEILAEQGGACAICGGNGDTSRTTRPLVVDHDHRTGLTRGLLCVSCNTGIGCFVDDPNRLLAAAAYVDIAAKCLSANPEPLD